MRPLLTLAAGAPDPRLTAWDRRERRWQPLPTFAPAESRFPRLLLGRRGVNEKSALSDALARYQYNTGNAYHLGRFPFCFLIFPARLAFFRSTLSYRPVADRIENC